MVINFGDGTAPLTVAAGTASPLLRSHAFANSGAYTVTATATDKDGGVSLSASHQITIGGPPSIISINSPSYSATTLSAAANVLSDAGYPLTERGMIYSPSATNLNPQIGGAGVLALTSPSVTTGPFALTLGNLTPNTAYRYRFYAINSQGTSYTAVQSFTTTSKHAPLLGLSGATGTFAPTGSMVTPRSWHSATLLMDGRVLASGGQNRNNIVISEAELYDPATGLWTTAGNMSVVRLWHTATRLTDGNVLLTGGISNQGGFYHRTADIFDTASATWIPTGDLSSTRHQHTATLLRDGQVLVAGGGTALAELYNPATGLWTPVGSSASARFGHTATLLRDGRVLIHGGILSGGGLLANSEIFDPATRTWSSAAASATPHHYHTADLLPNGKVIITGGYIDNTPLIGGVEIYDPFTNTWATGASPAVRRIRHTSNLLPDGRLLISGGQTTGEMTLGSAAVYDPVTGQWANAGTSASRRKQHTATLLSDGKVLISGGSLFNSATGLSDATGMAELHDRQTTATGLEGSPIAQSGTFYDEEGNATVTLTAFSGTLTQDNAAGTWTWAATAGDGPASTPITITAVDSLSGTATATFTLNVGNTAPVAGIAAPVNGDVGTPINFTFSAVDASSADAAAGFAWTLNFGDGTGPQSVPAGTASPLIRSHAFGNPGTFTITASATDKDGGLGTVASQVVSITGPPVVNLPVSSGITSIAATLGGTISQNGGFPVTERGVVYSITALNDQPVVGGTGVTKLKNPVNSTGSYFTNAVNLTPGTSYSFRAYATNSKGTGYSSLATFTTAANRSPVLAVDGAGSTPAFTPTSNLATARAFHMAVLLGSGKVLVAGGSSGTGAAFLSAEVYDPATGRWTATANLMVARDSPKAVLLPNGKVFVTGGTGTGGSLGSTELYDPAAGTWTPAAGMASPRYSHSAILLADGKVLVTGGQSDNSYLAGAEIYDPADGTWTATGSLAIARFAHTATLLPDGRVLVTGGHGTGSTLSNAEIYDPATGLWNPTGSMAAARRYHTETLLPHGKVLVTGGQSSLAASNYLDSTEIYDPAAGTWTPGATLPGSRYRHTAVLLRDNRVLISGGYAGSLPIASAALYDPASNLWSAAASLTVGRLTQTATLLADGRILVAGGNGSFLSNPLASTEIYGPPAPVVSVGEGLTVTKTGTFSDPEGNATTILTGSYGTVTQNNAAGTWSWTATGEDGPATSTVIVTATDTLGGISRATFTLSVTNRPPATEVTGPAMAAAGVPVDFTFTAADPAAPDQAAGFAWGLSYGDGTAVETTAAGTASPLGRSHTFSSAGTFTLTASATDKNSGKGTSIGKTVTVFSGLQGWRLIHFGSINDSGNAAILFDADADGLVNLAEFAFGLNPNSGASAQLPAAQRIGSNLVVTFPEPPGVAGSVIYRAEWSTDLSLGNWFPVSDSGTGGTHTFSVPMADRTKVFIRLVVTEG